jgi:hypothetical protein
MPDPQTPRLLEEDQPHSDDNPYVYDCPVCGREAYRAGRSVGITEDQVHPRFCLGEDHQWWEHDDPPEGAA